jgi:membrane protein required for beta-lactamase induction
MADRREEARRHVRRKRTVYTVLVVYFALVVLWFLIDVLTGADDWWFYWPTLGCGIIVVIIGVSMFGIGGLFGGDWEQRQIDKYLQRRGGSPDQAKGEDRQ